MVFRRARSSESLPNETSEARPTQSSKSLVNQLSVCQITPSTWNLNKLTSFDHFLVHFSKTSHIFFTSSSNAGFLKWRQRCFADQQIGDEFTEELKGQEENGEPLQNGSVMPDNRSFVNADKYFLPFELACKSKTSKIVEISLDCLQVRGFLSWHYCWGSNPSSQFLCI